ncbi:MAG: tyrosine-type recombinase/integrase [Gammaproteobacteria bacterium]|nr:tyrosine-type recombinase/integrase [Gammaproteobacteria bacterium]MDH3371836.1 tyrosine-type recombinase/integrase [Gammaproteobacteria bacterium]MDH3410490.1 tyrosine-type recombinase/integrase [Gammaproteobacteria bacterium]MDH3553415.1 tyrosine-type recombinase/integrase [Gammaproteobacteria bacterium]
MIRRLAEVEEEARRHEAAIFTFEEAAFRYLEEIAHKSSADTIAMHLDELFPFIGDLPIAQVHDGTIRPFIEHGNKRLLSPKTINNMLGVVSTVLNRAARVWRDEDGQPWLRQAPAQISRLSVKGKQAKPYPLSWSEQDTLFHELPRHLADAALFAVNTGCREQEVCQLRWDWEVQLPEMGTSVFILGSSITKTSTERVVVLNAVARRVIESRRGIHAERVFTYRGRPVGKLRSTAWRRAWKTVGLPTEPGILKGVHNLRHTFGRRLRSAGIPLETRKALLGHANGDITTHYSAAELEELINAAESIVSRGRTESPNLMLIRRCEEKTVGKVSEIKKGLTA